MKNKPFLVLVAIVLIVIGSVMVSRRQHEAAAATESPAPKQDTDRTIMLSEASLRDNPIITAKATRRPLVGDVSIVGSVTYDEDHYAVVGPLVPGRIVRLYVGVGAAVHTGQPLAELESQELGEARAAMIGAKASAEGADANLKRESELAAQRISSAREHEQAKVVAVSENAKVRAARERLRALGLTKEQIDSLGEDAGHTGHVVLRAPIDGVVLARTVTLGQSVERATNAFTIVNLSHLWVMLELYEKDLERVHVKQPVELSTESLPGKIFHATVAYIEPVVAHDTRTAKVRIEFDNPDGDLRPGQFVTARLVGEPGSADYEAIAVPRQAVQTVDGTTHVFVRNAKGFEPRRVDVGGTFGDWLEIRSGLHVGEEVATDGAFLLKSALLR